VGSKSSAELRVLLTESSLLEASLVQESRRWATPTKARDLKNPVTATPETLVQGWNRRADHCVTCHANNGSGETEIGRNLYPKAPDMRERDTQSLSDIVGSLFFFLPVFVWVQP